jgi:hypothetical protein
LVGSPNARRVRASQLFGDFAQHRVIVGGAALRNNSPVHRFGREMEVAILSDQIAVPPFRVDVFLLHEGDAALTIL